MTNSSINNKVVIFSWMWIRLLVIVREFREKPAPKYGLFVVDVLAHGILRLLLLEFTISVLLSLESVDLVTFDEQPNFTVCFFSSVFPNVSPITIIAFPCFSVCGNLVNHNNVNTSRFYVPFYNKSGKPCPFYLQQDNMIYVILAVYNLVHI